MAETQQQMQREIEQFQVPPPLPKGVHVSDEIRDLDTNLRQQLDVMPHGPEREEIAYALRELVHEVENAVGAKERPFGKVKIRTEFTNPQGEYVVREIDDSGKVRDHVTPKAETEKLQAVEQLRIDAAHSIKDDIHEATELRQLAGQTDDAFAADAILTRANELSSKAIDRRERLVEAIETDARSRGLSEEAIGTKVRSYEVPYETWLPGRTVKDDQDNEEQLPGPRDAVEALKANKVAEAYEIFRGLTPPAQQQFLKRTDKPEFRDAIDAMSRMESDEREADASANRIALWGVR